MKNVKRLFSLDVLRGLDMFLLTVIGPLFAAINRLWPQTEAVQAQFNHAWGGFTLWDIIMPLFIFMCGAAMPFALSRRLDEEGRPTGAYWKHVFLRVLLLWFCGMLVQGNLATLDILKISPYNNTLETIAAGYLIAAIVLAIPSRLIRIVIPILFVALYGLMLHYLGDAGDPYSKTGNFAALIEAKALTKILPLDNQFMKALANPNVGVPYHGYTWFLTTLMFGFMTLCGVHCAEILRNEQWEKRRKAVALLILGGALLGIGWGLVFCGVPMIKHIFTVSFTCQAMGWSILALALLYVLTDILEFRRGWWIITLFGQCALTAYMASHFFYAPLRTCAETICQGVPHILRIDQVQKLTYAEFIRLNPPEGEQYKQAFGALSPDEYIEANVASVLRERKLNPATEKENVRKELREKFLKAQENFSNLKFSEDQKLESCDINEFNLLRAALLLHRQNLNRLFVALMSAALLTLVCWLRRRLRGTNRPSGGATEAPLPTSGTAQSAHVQATKPLDNGAVATRFQLPGESSNRPPVPTSVQETGEANSQGPKMASKVRLQLHRESAEAPTVELKPRG